MTKIKKIKGTDYSVTNTGKILSEKNGDFRWLKRNEQGQVVLCTNGKIKPMLVHRLVAQSFVPVPEQYQGMSIDELDVHHANFNHFENRASNLMWLTKAEHMQLHSDSEVTFERRSAANKGENNPMYGKQLTDEHKRKLSEVLINHSVLSKSVAQYTKEGVFVAKYASTMEAQRRTNIAQASICSCCKGKRKSAGGFKWKYAA